MSAPLTQFAALLDRLERRAGMYVQPVSYETLIASLSGYDGAKVESGAPSVVEAFGEWLHEREKGPFEIIFCRIYRCS